MDEERKRYYEEKIQDAHENMINKIPYLYADFRNRKEKFTFEPIKLIDKINNIGVYIEDSKDLIKDRRNELNEEFPSIKSKYRGCSIDFEYWYNRPNRIRKFENRINYIKNNISYCYQWMNKIISICEELKTELEQEKVNAD